MRGAAKTTRAVTRRAVDEGPQHVSVRGEPAAVVLSEQDYRQLTSQRPSIVDHILGGEPWPDDLVDTNVLSEARRGHPEARDWLRSVDPDHVFLSVVTLGEIIKGISQKTRSHTAAAVSLHR